MTSEKLNAVLRMNPVMTGNHTARPKRLVLRVCFRRRTKAYRGTKRRFSGQLPLFLWSYEGEQFYLRGLTAELVFCNEIASQTTGINLEWRAVFRFRPAESYLMHKCSNWMVVENLSPNVGLTTPCYSRSVYGVCLVTFKDRHYGTFMKGSTV